MHRNRLSYVMWAAIALSVVAVYASESTDKPQITSVSPDNPVGVDGKQRFLVSGRNFDRLAKVTLRDLKTGETFEDRHVIERSTRRLELSVNFTSTPSRWSVEVINPGNVSSDPFEFDVVKDLKAPGVPATSPPASPEAKGSSMYRTRLGWVHPLGHDATVTSRWLAGFDQSSSRIDDRGESSGGYIEDRVHLGVDFRASVDAPVYAIADGTVVAVYAQNDCVAIRHEAARGPFVALYAHIRPIVKSGQSVKGGERVATIAPHPLGHHLHFGIAWGAEAPQIDPNLQYGWGRAHAGYFAKHGIPNGLVDPIAWLNTQAPKSN